MNNTDSPAISRRQRVDDSKYPVSNLSVLPDLNSQLYKENPKARVTSSGRCGILNSPRLQKFLSQIPGLRKAQELALRVPPRVRCVFIFFWVAWKVVLLVAFVVIVAKKPIKSPASSSSAIFQKSNFTQRNQINGTVDTNGIGTKVLYIVTSPSKYSDGSRNAVEGRSRFLNQLLPVMIDTVESMVEKSTFNLEVDVFLVCEYVLKPKQEEMIRNQLPFGVGFQFWDDATPLAYTGKNGSISILKDHHALARQHQFVVRDKLEFYDVFIAFEDDMLVRGEHVHHYLQLSAEIERLLALLLKDARGKGIHNYNRNDFFGNFTKQQLERLIPGFIPVEAIENEKVRGIQSRALQTPIDLNDPTSCCHVHTEVNGRSSRKVPQNLASEDLIAWETNVKAFSLHQFPTESNLLDWVALMMGPQNNLREEQASEGFGSKRKGALNVEDRPQMDEVSHLLAKQGGWMATKTQLVRMNNQLCKSYFLPSFSRNYEKYRSYNDVGTQNIESRSESNEVFTGGCNIQRMISMNPNHFSKHLLYHTADHRQTEIERNSTVRINDLFDQLNHLRKTAKQEKLKL